MCNKETKTQVEDIHSPPKKMAILSTISYGLLVTSVPPDHGQN